MLLMRKINEDKVIVKTVPSGTKFKTLDGIERTWVHEEDLMICNGEKPMYALRGVLAD